ncbi:MAG: hypothetical protein Kow006_27540 [Gammaproteobacteria bacterium]
MNAVDLVFTVALPQELPVEWLREQGVAVHRLKALESGALRPGDGANSGLLVVITGVGPGCARDAALWIRDRLAPRYVVNLGTAGALGSERRGGAWVTPKRVTDEAGRALPVDTRLPFPWPDGHQRHIGGTLLSVVEARPGHPLPQWQAYEFVDMETHAQAEVFAEAGIHFHVVKWISDAPGDGAEQAFRKALPKLREACRALFSFLASEPQADISVVIPVHNRAGRIAACLDSVLRQTRPAAEVIVVDDGSDDETPRILRRFGDRVRMIRLPENRGVSAARNAGVSAAASPWIALLDSDDHWTEDKLEAQWRYLKRNPHYEALQSEEIWIRNGVRVNPRLHHRKPAGWIWSQSLERCLVSPSAILMRRSLFEVLGGFDESLPACEDYDLWIRLARHRVVGLVPHAGVIKHGGHQDQLSRRFPAMDRFRVASLHKALQVEGEPEFRKPLVKTMNTKLTILIQGARKRGLVDEVRRYEALRRELVAASHAKSANPANEDGKNHATQEAGAGVD